MSLPLLAHIYFPAKVQLFECESVGEAFLELPDEWGDCSLGHPVGLSQLLLFSDFTLVPEGKDCVVFVVVSSYSPHLSRALGKYQMGRWVLGWEEGRQVDEAHGKMLGPLPVAPKSFQELKH